jgi:hypothetical protein
MANKWADPKEARALMTHLWDLQEQIGDVGDLLTTFHHEQLAHIFYNLCRDKVRSSTFDDKDVTYAYEFSKAMPRGYYFYGIDGDIIVEEHALVNYMSKLVDEGDLNKKSADKHSKRKWIQKIDQALRGFLYILDEDPFDHYERQDDEDGVDLSNFEFYLRHCAADVFTDILRIHKDNVDRDQAIASKRRELFNAKRRAVRAERKLDALTQNLEAMRADRERVAADLRNMID